MTKKSRNYGFVQYIPTLTNEQIRTLPVHDNKTKVGRDVVLTEKGNRYVSCIWNNPFGEK